MTLGEIYTIFTKVLDVAILWFIFYYILKYIRKNVKLTLIFKGVLNSCDIFEKNSFFIPSNSIARS